MSTSILLASLIAAAAQDPTGATELRGSLVLERPAAGAKHVLAYRLGDGAGRGIDKRMLFDRVPDVRGVADAASSFALVRILTWDLAAHIQWLQNLPEELGPTTGGTGLEPAPPRPGDALYWMTVAPIFRLLLHPQAVSRAETLAHLVELGEPTLSVLSAAAGEKCQRTHSSAADAEEVYRPRVRGIEQVHDGCANLELRHGLQQPATPPQVSRDWTQCRAMREAVRGFAPPRRSGGAGRHRTADARSDPPVSPV